MNNQEMRDYLASVNLRPDQIPGHACELWEDGEITLTKCNNGELYGMRNLHSIDEGNPAQALPLEIFPNQQYNGHAFVRVSSIEDARRIRDTLSWPQ